MIDAALERGLILLKAGLHGNCIRVLCPLTIEDAVLDEALAVWEDALASRWAPKRARTWRCRQALVTVCCCGGCLRRARGRRAGFIRRRRERGCVALPEGGARGEPGPQPSTRRAAALVALEREADQAVEQLLVPDPGRGEQPA